MTMHLNAINSVTPKSYLARAREWIVSLNDGHMPYAAFELRACIEARQADYYSAYDWKRGQKIRPWRISELSKKLHEHWPDQKIAEIIYDLPSGPWATYFTPLSKALVKAASEDLGELLHSMPDSIASDDTWLADRRARLTDCYRQAWVACQGQHIAMPLWNAKTREMHPALMYCEDREFERLEELASLTKESQMSFSIEYLDQPPADWKCDL